MIEITTWMNTFLRVLHECFGERVWFVGLQGSYARDEATDKSDIDIVVILNELSVSDIERYDNMLDTLTYRELVCGFLSGKKELLNWDDADLFQFYYDTRPIIGSLDELLPHFDESVIDRAIKMGACNIYHGCVHNMLHEKSDAILQSLYKSASFVMQAICFKRTGTYITHQQDLLSKLEIEEQTIVQTNLLLKNGGTVDFDKMSELLFNWSKKWIMMKK